MSSSTRAPSGQRILMLLGNNPYPQDPRVRHEATTLAAAGHQVTVIAPRRPGQPFRDAVDGVAVARVPAPFQGESTVAQVLDHVFAAATALAASVLLAVRPGFDVVHVHNPPDTLGMVGALWQWRSRRFVFDHHDLAAEMYVARAGDGTRPAVRRALAALERLCCSRADRVIATNESYREVEIEDMGVDPERIAVVRNGPDIEAFANPRPRGRCGSPVVCYAGVIGAQDGVDELVRAIGHLVHDLGRDEVQCVVVGDGHGLETARALAAELGVAPWIHFTGLLPFDEMVERIAAADVCVEPAPSNRYNDRSTTIKLMEYMAAGKAAVAYDLRENRVTGGDAVHFVEANCPWLLAEAIADLIDDPDRLDALGRAGRARVEDELDWRHQAGNVLAVYESLVAGAR